MNAPSAIDRKRFIGGSDAAAILGVSPWTTSLGLFLIKTGQQPEISDPAREKLFRRGKRLEPVVIDMLVEELGVKVTKRSLPEKPNRYIDAELPYLAAEIDFEWEVTPEIAARYNLPEVLIGTVQNGEVKTVHPFASAKFGDAETDEIPIEYAAQAMHGLMVAGRQLTMFGVLVGADNLTPYFILRDDETIAGLREKEQHFWEYNVLRGVAPVPVNLPDVLELFGRTPASRVEATPEILLMVESLAGARDAARAAEDAQVECKFQIGQFMLGQAGITLGNDGRLIPGAEVKVGNHELTVKGASVLVVAKRAQSRLDGDQIKAKYPTVALECQKSIEFFVFGKPPKKGRK